MTPPSSPAFAAPGSEAASGSLAPTRRPRRLPDAEVLRLLAQLSPARLLYSKPTVARMRRAWQLCVKAFATREPVAEVAERIIAAQDGREVQVRMYVPAELVGGEHRPALLWIHGGGFVFGDLYTSGATCRRLANACGCVVFAVRYRLAPESSLHDGLADCLDAFDGLVGEASALAIDPARIAVGGDSAGGALAALVAQRRAVGDRIGPSAQLLVYPATNLSSEYVDARMAPIADRMLAELFRWLQLEIPRRDLDDPALSPIRGAAVRPLAPTILLTAGFDPLRDEAFAFASRLAKGGTDVRVLHFPGQFHGFLSFDGVLQGARAAFSRIGSSMRSLEAGEQIETGLDEIDAGFLRSWSWHWLNPVQRFREAVVTLVMAREALSATTVR